jgi:hypothetical protein
VSNDAGQRDLIGLVADRNIKSALCGLLDRPKSLGIRSIDCDVLTHSQHDPGCCHRSPEFLRPFHQQYSYAIVMFDHEGCGREATSAAELEEEIEQQLASSGWGNRATVIVLVPELEAWVWSASPEVDRALNWSDRNPGLRDWLVAEGHLEEGQRKPPRPKEAVEHALREVRRPRSSSIYRDLATSVSFTRCSDPALLKLIRKLQQWYPRTS